MNNQSDISNTELLERLEQLYAFHPQEERFIRLPEVIHMTGMGRSTLLKRVVEQAFPAGQKISGEGRMTVWRLSEVQAWIQAEIEAAESEPA